MSAWPGSRTALTDRQVVRYESNLRESAKRLRRMEVHGLLPRCRTAGFARGVRDTGFDLEARNADGRRLSPSVGPCAILQAVVA